MGEREHKPNICIPRHLHSASILCLRHFHLLHNGVRKTVCEAVLVGMGDKAERTNGTRSGTV